MTTTALERALIETPVKRSVYKDYRWCSTADPVMWQAKQDQGWKPCGDVPVTVNDLVFCEKSLAPDSPQFLNVFLTGRKNP